MPNSDEDKKILSKNLIDLDTAISEIKQACTEAKENKERSPFFFMVGSGISYPSVPLAPEVQKQCEEKARKLDRTSLPREEDPANTYSHWFRAAYPQRRQRQRYLEGLIDGVPITHANFRLAHLLLSGAVTNIVVTPNFDNLLQRALSLFGKRYLICDDPRTVERINPEQDDIQLIHVHGSYLFYDCRNTSDEIEERAKPLADTTLTMAALLDRILAFRAPLVIGYNGWENDVFMTALRRHLLSPLPFNLYWFCYRRSNIANLPEWLQEHADVYFIVPDEDSEDTVDDTSEEAAELKEDKDAEIETASVNSVRTEPTLDATRVLDALVRQLNVDTPPLAKNPLSFYAEQLRNDLPREDVKEGSDVYSLRNLVARVERARDKEAEDATKVQENEARLQKMRDALGRAQYGEVVEHAREIEPDTLTEDQLSELLTAMNTSIGAIADNDPLKASACDFAISWYEVVAKKRRTHQPASLQKQIVNIINYRGNISFASKQYEAAVGFYDQAINRFGSSSESTVQEALGAVITNRILALRNLSRFQDAVDSSDSFLKQHAGTVGDGFLSSVVAAYSFKGEALVSLKRPQEALEAFNLGVALGDSAKTLTDYAKNQLSNMKKSQQTVKNSIASATANNSAVTTTKEDSQAKEIPKP